MENVYAGPNDGFDAAVHARTVSSPDGWVQTNKYALSDEERSEIERRCSDVIHRYGTMICHRRRPNAYSMRVVF